jgi:hypothetical protein
VLAEDLLSITTDSGFILLYDQGTLVSVKKEGEYQLYFPELDSNASLIGGMIVKDGGARVLFKDGKPVVEISAAGEITAYHPDGKPRSFTAADGRKVRFAYRLAADGSVLATLSLEDAVSSLYQASLPTWILMNDGTDIRYQNGLIAEYRDGSGNLFTYSDNDIRTNGVLSGFLSKLASVKPSGAAVAIPYSTIITQLNSYPALKNPRFDWPESNHFPALYGCLHDQSSRIKGGRKDLGDWDGIRLSICHIEPSG